MGDFGRGSDVGDLPGGIGRRFDPDQPRLSFADSAPNSIVVGGMEHIHADAKPAAEILNPVPQPVVHDFRHDHVGAGTQTLKHRRCGGHAGGEQQRRGAALGLPQHGLCGKVARIFVAAVGDPFAPMGVVRVP